MNGLINAASAHMGGAVTYLKNVLRWLPEVAPEHRFQVCVPEDTAETLREQGTLGNVRLVEYPFDRTNGLARLYFDQVTVPRWVRQRGIDVLYSSTGFGTFWCPCPEILLVRNPIYFNKAFHAKYRELGRSLARTRIRRWHSLLSIRRADRVHFPTRAMQAMVEQYIALDRTPTRAIHYGFNDEYFRSEPDDRAPDWVADLERLKEEGYTLLLNVSTYAVHKNFETLIEALARVKGEGPPVKLITTTSRERTSDKEEHAALHRRADELGVADTWIELGYVPYRHLHRLYGTADVYVFPSFTESFGHTMVEAMASGLPVVAADTPVNREVCEGAGVYFDPFDPADCARAVTEVVGKDARRAALSEAAAERARHFSWRRHTEQLVQSLEEVSMT